MIDSKDVGQFLEKKIRELSQRLDEIVSERTTLDKEWGTLSEELRAHQVVLAGLPGQSGAAPRLQPHVPSTNGRGRKPRTDLDPLLRSPLMDRQEHRLKDILEGIKKESGITIARSTARTRYERMSDVEKIPGRLSYRLRKQ